MNRALAPTLFPLLLLAACASVEDGAGPLLMAAAASPGAASSTTSSSSGAPGASAAHPAAANVFATSSPAVAPRSGSQPVTAVADRAADRPADALSIWRDPEFRRRFDESYLAESEIEPRLGTTERERMQRILGLLAEDERDEAVEALEDLRGPAASAVFDFTLANLHFQADEFEAAAEAYQVAVQKYPKFRRAWKNLGLIHVRRNAFAPAVEAFTRVIELGGGDAVSYGLLGFACSQQGDELSAETAFRMAALLDPATLDWRMGLARSLFARERFADAASLCGTLIEQQPGRAELWTLQANAFLGLGQTTRAAENLELADRLGGSTPESLTLLGDVYVNEELFELAVDAYLRAADMDPVGDPSRAIRAAKVLTARGALAQTRRLVERLEVRHGDQLDEQAHKELLKLRAYVSKAEGRGDEQARVLEEIVALDPLDGEALVLLGEHSWHGGDVEQAVFWFERAAGLDAHEARAKLRHGQMLVGEGRYAEALPLLRRAQTLDPRDNVAEYIEQVERVALGR